MLSTSSWYLVRSRQHSIAVESGEHFRNELHVRLRILPVRMCIEDLNVLRQ